MGLNSMALPSSLKLLTFTPLATFWLCSSNEILNFSAPQCVALKMMILSSTAAIAMCSITITFNIPY